MREIFLMLHFFGLAMSFGIGITMLVMMRSLSRLTPDERGQVMSRLKVLMPIGPTGLLLLIASGIGLTIPVWEGLKTEGLFHVKLTAVTLIVILMAYNILSGAKGKPSTLSKFLMPLPLLLSIIVVILAVLIFH